MFGEHGVECRTEEAAVVSGFGQKVAGIRSVQAGKPRRGRRVEPVGIRGPDQVLYLRKRAGALA